MRRQWGAASGSHGRSAVEIEGERIEGALRGRQGRLLLAYLVLNRCRPVRRDELVEALWSEAGPPEGGEALLAAPASRRPGSTCASPSSATCASRPWSAPTSHEGIAEGPR